MGELKGPRRQSGLPNKKGGGEPPPLLGPAGDVPGLIP
jgi:hypothetical protein